MKNITGIGGFFFRSKDPKALKVWYINVLGVDVQEMVWQQQAGPTVLETFKQDSDHFSKDKQWMLNFRVTDLKLLIQDLESKGIAVEQKEEWNSMQNMACSHVLTILKEILLNFGNQRKNNVSEIVT